MKIAPLALCSFLAYLIPFAAQAQEQAAAIFERVLKVYGEVPTYADEAAVRLYRAQGVDFRTATGPEINVPHEREEYFFYRTAFQRPHNFRLIALKAGDAHSAVTKASPATVLIRERDQYSEGDRSSLDAKEFDTAVVAATRSEGWNISLIPRGLIRGMYFRESWYTVGEAEATVFDEHPVWKIRLDSHNAVQFLWVDQATSLIRKLERVALFGNELVVITAIHDIDPYRNLGSGDFSRVSDYNHGLNTDPDHWPFEDVDVPAAMNALAQSPVKSSLAWKAAENPSPSHTAPQRTSRSARGPLVQRLTPEQMASIVLISTDDGQGTGFMARINDLPFVITNLHVLNDAKNLQITTTGGQSLQLQAAFAAKGHDVALLRVNEVPASLILAGNALDSLIGDEVAVVGNRLGGGVLTQEIGRIIGIGPARIEVDAKFQPGNSGSPIINLRTGEVVGIATYIQKVSLTDRGETASKNENINRELTSRWFGFRFDSVSSWDRIDWNEWGRQMKALRDYGQKSEVLFALLRNEPDVYMADPAMRAIIERYERDMLRNRNEDAAVRRTRELVIDLMNYSRRDANSLDGTFYDYFRTGSYFDSSIPLQKEFRQQLTSYLQERERDFRAMMKGR